MATNNDITEGLAQELDRKYKIHGDNGTELLKEIKKGFKQPFLEENLKRKIKIEKNRRLGAELPVN